jgi:hypothetical protein
VIVPPAWLRSSDEKDDGHDAARCEAEERGGEGRGRQVGKEHMRAIFLVAMGVLSLVGHAMACSCTRPGSAKIGLRLSDAVFLGDVLTVRDSVQKMPNGGARKFLIASVRVKEAWKGVCADTVVTMFTGYGGGDCGYEFEQGGEYLIYAHGPRLGFLITSICTRTKPAVLAFPDLAELMRPPRELNSRAR